ncbi:MULTISPECIES: discoidin domain-containing protein [Actinosynnema]|uniref:discoidin domain-containing protein n=1 Tax=Actinosynnema TaxID=40566 RepID=UPI0020A27E31|nr:discoidin domain-containing protein [Actinosynnema pretiosum]MCP2097599.1 Pectate lyase superfamily protein [Actinosynnema pretiosum]
MSRTTLPAAALATAALVAAALAVTTSGSAAPHPELTSDGADGAGGADGSGASVPFVEHEAETAAHNGVVIGPDHTQGTLASEASGRRAVTLSGQGRHVEFTLTAPANALVLRYNVPDGTAGTAAVHVDGTKLADLPVTSKYSYLDTPHIAGSTTHHLFDESRLLLGRDLPAGAEVKVQLDAGSVARLTVDLVDFEQVAPAAAKPAGAVSITDHGAVPGDGRDDADALARAIGAARASGAQVWIPADEFEVRRGLPIDQVTVRGAGMWHSVLRSDNPFLNHGQVAGNIRLHDFAVLGEVTERVDDRPDNAYHGPLGANSVISGLWMQHLKVGIWTMSGTTSNAVIENNRFLDLLAAGLNFNGRVTDSVVRDNFLRNTGDDALAMWSVGANARDRFEDNTVVQPNLANGIAIYGGADITVRGNLVRDTNALGSGIAISNQAFLHDGSFSPLAGTTVVASNTLVRTGAINPNWGSSHPHGALRVDSYDTPVTTPISLTDNRFVDSPYSAIQVVDGSGRGNAVTSLSVDGASVEGVGTVVLQAETRGQGRFTGVTASRVGASGVYDCGGGFVVTRGSGNSGWDGRWADCGSWPPRTDPGPAPTTTTTALPAGNVALGKPVVVSGAVDGHRGANVVDGDARTYWESPSGAFPQEVAVDLGAVRQVRRLVLKLPADPAWGARTQTIAVSGSVDGTSYRTVVGATGHRFDAASGNAVTIAVTGEHRHVRLTFTGNTGWAAAQLAEFEVHAS